MSTEYRDSVSDQSTTTGTVPLTISGIANPGCRTIASAHTNGATLHYRIQDATNANWEVGEGIWFSGANVLMRGTVFASSNANALVSFAAGTKTVMTTLVAKDVQPTTITSTWAAQSTAIAAIAATSAGIGFIFFTDVGPSGALYYCNGTTITRDAPIDYFQCAVTFFMPCSGSVGNNGALTLGTATQAIVPPGYAYYPANAIYSGSAAGQYWTVMSSTTVGIIYNNIYTSGQPVYISSPTPFVTAGTVPYTQITAEVTLVTVPYLGGLMGNNGLLEMYFDNKNCNAGSTRTFNARLNGTVVRSFAASSNSVYGLHGLVLNRGLQTAQSISSPSVQAIDGTTAVSYSSAAVDTSINSNLTFSVQLTAATDSYSIDKILVQIRPMP